jgi:hypothetical protein
LPTAEAAGIVSLRSISPWQSAHATPCSAWLRCEKRSSGVEAVVARRAELRPREPGAVLRVRASVAGDAVEALLLAVVEVAEVRADLLSAAAGQEARASGQQREQRRHDGGGADAG